MAYLKRIEARPAFRKAMAVAGPKGCGTLIVASVRSVPPMPPVSCLFGHCLASLLGRQSADRRCRRSRPAAHGAERTACGACDRHQKETRCESSAHFLTLAVTIAVGCPGVFAQNVKITPLGTHPGELCSRDRATIFEDPSGLRILYDAGHSVTGADDPRLGTIHVVLVSTRTAITSAIRRSRRRGRHLRRPEVVSAAPTRRRARSPRPRTPRS